MSTTDDQRRNWTDEELRQFGIDFAQGKIFGSGHVPPDSGMRIQHVFLPLNFLTPDDLANMQKLEIVCFFEYLSEAGERSINGFPIFMSFKTLTRTELDKVIAAWGEAERAMDKVRAGEATG